MFLYYPVHLRFAPKLGLAACFTACTCAMNHLLFNLWLCKQIDDLDLTMLLYFNTYSQMPGSLLH
jgi:hypothetical protein